MHHWLNWRVPECLSELRKDSLCLFPGGLLDTVFFRAVREWFAHLLQRWQRMFFINLGYGLSELIVDYVKNPFSFSLEMVRIDASWCFVILECLVVFLSDSKILVGNLALHFVSFSLLDIAAPEIFDNIGSFFQLGSFTFFHRHREQVGALNALLRRLIGICLAIPPSALPPSRHLDSQAHAQLWREDWLWL